MFVLNEVLVKILEDRKQAIDVNAIELNGTDYLNGLWFPGIDDAVQRKIAPHRFERDVAGDRHLIFYQQIPHHIPWPEALVLHRFDVTIEVEMKVGRDMKAIIPGPFLGKADGEKLVEVKEIGLKISFDSNRLVFEQ